MTTITNKKQIATLTHSLDGKKFHEFPTNVPLYANEICGSDCYAYEVIEIISPRKLKLRALTAHADAERGHCFYTNQVWTFSSDENRSPLTITMRKNGRWKAVGDKSSVWYSLSLKPRHRIDPNF